MFSTSFSTVCLKISLVFLGLAVQPTWRSILVTFVIKAYKSLLNKFVQSVDEIEEYLGFEQLMEHLSNTLLLLVPLK